MTVLDCRQLRILRDMLCRDGYAQLQYVPYRAHASDYSALHRDLLIEDEARLMAASASGEPILYMYSLDPEFYARRLTRRQRLLGDIFLYNLPIPAATVRSELPDYVEHIAELSTSQDPFLSGIRLAPIFDVLCIADELAAQRDDHVFLDNDSVQMARFIATSKRLTGKVVADIGTGSGILALMARKVGASRVIATDINPRALEYSAATFQVNGYPDIEVRGGSIDRVLDDAEVIVANPPYMIDRDALALRGGGEYGLDTATYYVNAALERGREIMLVLDLPAGRSGDVFEHEVAAVPSVKTVLRRRPGFELVVYEYRQD